MFFKSRKIKILWLVLLPFMFSLCSTDEKGRLEHTLTKLRGQIEKRNIDTISQFISDNYTDEEGRNKEAIIELLKTYLGKYKGIAINILEQKITQFKPDLATIEIEVSLSSGAAQFLRKAVKFYGEYFRFSLNWQRGPKNWQVLSSQWQSITTDELYPESKKTLKKIFPDDF